VHTIRHAHPGPGVRGLRWGELVPLTARRIDLARRRIEVVEAITEVHDRVIIGTTKTPVGPHAWESLIVATATSSSRSTVSEPSRSITERGFGPWMST
jgi:hypothetical protein